MHPSFQSKLDRLEQQRQAYTHQVNSVTQEKHNQKPAEDQWSVAQLYFHLWKVEQVVLKSITDNIASNRTHKPISFNTRYRSFLLNLFLSLPIKFKVPKLVGDMPDQINPAEVEQKWLATRKELLQLVDSYPADLLHKEIFKHPRAGLITLGQTLDFLIEHADHHRKQMKRLLA